jgi:hypothetical protein
MNDKSESTKNFLEDLRKITLKHGISIAGCGCCGSPFIDPITDKDGFYEINDQGEWLIWETKHD